MDILIKISADECERIEELDRRAIPHKVHTYVVVNGEVYRVPESVQVILKSCKQRDLVFSHEHKGGHYAN